MSSSDTPSLQWVERNPDRTPSFSQFAEDDGIVVRRIALEVQRLGAVFIRANRETDTITLALFTSDQIKFNDAYDRPE